tara:strand:- start:112 stop:444 length:333 start_codon:yes stop_codon:yes gene_type:complete
MFPKAVNLCHAQTQVKSQSIRPPLSKQAKNRDKSSSKTIRKGTYARPIFSCAHHSLVLLSQVALLTNAQLLLCNFPSDGGSNDKPAALARVQEQNNFWILYERASVVSSM